MSNWAFERLYHTIINAKNLDETIAFYRLLGFEVLHDRRHLDWPPHVGQMFGMDRGKGKGVLMVLPGDPNGPMLDVVEWIDPQPRFNDPSDRGNVPRVLAFRVRNILAAYEDLKQKGVVFTGQPNEPRKASPNANVIAVCCCRDPNGTIIEMIELVPGARHSQDTPKQ
jgi:catechol 2,3-dioxygenase-like lactoylglutathione lyase family enzyme